jgi:hypothetical protein
LSKLKQKDRKTGKQKDRKTGKQKEKQKDWKTDRHENKKELSKLKVRERILTIDGQMRLTVE